MVDFDEALIQLIRDELAILNLSQLNYKKYTANTFATISGENFSAWSRYVFMNLNTDSIVIPNNVLRSARPLVLDNDWKEFCNKSFFKNLIKIINGNIRVEKHWRRDIRNAAILMGQSRTSEDLIQAFLWNVIALELLLTQQGDKYVDALPLRVEAFLGWTGYWKIDGFEDKIRNVYKKRSAFVHDGRREHITNEDLFFTEELLLNLLTNIVEHHHIFSSKQAIIEFSKKVQAEHLLGVPPKIRPKTLRYISRGSTRQEFS